MASCLIVLSSWGYGSVCGDATALESLKAPFFQAHQGIRQSIPQMDFPSSTETYLLSVEGPHSQVGRTAKVYLIKPPDAAPYVLKIYRSQETYEQDRDAMQILKKALVQRHVEFQVPDVETEGLPPLTMKMPYTPGRALNSVLMDPEIATVLKRHLATRYSDLTMDYLTSIREAIPTATLAGVMREAALAEYQVCSVVFWISPPNGPKRGLMLKTQQVIVSPEDLSMTIVDPF